MAYWQGFRRFVPLVPVVPVQNGRGRKKSRVAAARVVGAAGFVLRLKRAGETHKSPLAFLFRVIRTATCDPS